eukprot:1161047-Pelagomonas_calceolata.AAC.65
MKQWWYHGALTRMTAIGQNSPVGLENSSTPTCNVKLRCEGEVRACSFYYFRQQGMELGAHGSMLLNCSAVLRRKRTSQPWVPY